MIVAGLWRYPVKSMQGEPVERLGLGGRGVVGDRRYGVLDLASGTVISAKRDGRLLGANATLDGGEVGIVLPTGERTSGTGSAVDAALSDWLDRPVRLVEATPDRRATFESPSDFEEDDSELERWEGPPGSFVDSSPVHVLTTASLRALARERPELQWEPRRFRPNVLVEAEGDELVEEAWVGRRLSFAAVAIDVVKPCSRCVMTTREQPGGITRQLDVLRHVNGAHATNLGVLAAVARDGTIAVAEAVAVDGR